MSTLRRSTCLIILWSLPMLAVANAQKPPLTLDEFFNAVDIRSVQISPDGKDVVIETMRPDWTASRFRNELWLYRDERGGMLIPLTPRIAGRSPVCCGYESAPKWSPDGRWIGFISASTIPASKASADRPTDEKIVAQVYVVSRDGGAASQVTGGDEDVHVFAWSADSSSIYFATRSPETKRQPNAYKGEWRDVLRLGESELGDSILSVEVLSTLTPGLRRTSNRAASPKPRELAATPYRVDQMASSPDGHSLAFTTASPSELRESSDPYGIYTIDLTTGGAPRLVLHTAGHPQSWAGAGDICWSPDSSHIFFIYDFGTPEGPFEIPQTRLYWENATGGEAVRWASAFTGHVETYAMTREGGVLLGGRLGIEVKPYLVPTAEAKLSEQPSRPGTYWHFSVAQRSPRVAFVFSSLQQPAEVYLAEGPDQLRTARPITAFNKLFTERELPQWKLYRWTADDGTPIEGILIYPLGKVGAKHLPMLTLIHGGPEEVDGNYFEADWYKWAMLAATQGWLVFEPNYRGSLGYGDAFALGIVPHMNSRPGEDILEGVDALVRDGIADPEQLAVGGYSAGGTLTNWLITHTARFKAAVTGAGAVEDVTSWGTDNAPFEHAYMLGGLPWEAEANYNSEAPIWQVGKVTTPTHIVAGADDINVPVNEAYLLKRALTTRGVLSSLLIFPGEGHGLDKDPWHGKIKVREELKWLEKYGKKSP
jgi:dipeptidyl aminopeptidase/acylaminoacyl peptidase